MSQVLEIYNSHPLRAFLDARRTANSRDASMTGMGTELPGKWIVNDADYPRFFDLLHDYLFVRNGRTLNLVEQPRLNHPKPLLIDLDFRYSPAQRLDRYFTMDHIKSFCNEVVKGLGTFFSIEDYEHLRFFVTLRPEPYQEKGVRKDGVHIECPDICLSNEKQKVLRAWILHHRAVARCFEGTNFINSEEDIYDESMTRKQGWFFFGESKPNIQSYKVAAVYRYEPEAEELIEEDTAQYSNRALLELLSVRYNLNDDDNAVKEESLAEYQGFLRPANTFQTAPAAQTPSGTDSMTVTGQENPLIAALRDFMPKEYTEEERGIVKALVRNCLSVDRADKYETWIRVGWCLHNIEPSQEMFDLWMEFSKKSPKYSGNNIDSLRRDWFGRMRKEGDGPRLTELALRKWARDDNPTEYKNIIDSNILEYIRSAVDATHFHIARLMKKLYEGNYVASINAKSTEWFFYDDALNMWKHLNQGIQLRKNISFEVADYIARARDKIRMDMLRATSEDAREAYNNKLKKLLDVETKLYNTSFTESVMKMAATFFYEEDFQNKLNANVFLFGCKNGVLELRAKGEREGDQEHVIFRDGRPEDFVSFLAGQNLPDSDAISYTPFDQLNEEQQEHLAGLKDFFAKIFPRADLRAYVLRLLASCLEGVNREQCYYTFIGQGGNGKSKLMDLVRLAFGDYYTTLQTTVLTRKRPDSGAANPEIMVIKNKRFISMAEPDEKEPINTSRMKQLSGEDIIEARGLFQDQEKFKVTGKMIMCCNKLPPVHSMDNGTWRRIRVVPFESKFVTPEDPDYKSGKPNVYPRDPELDRKLRTWREVFLSWLVYIYETEYIVNGLEPVPDIVKRESMDYKETFDSYARFSRERLRKVAGEKATFKLVSQAYNNWVQEGNRKGSRLTPKELEKRLQDEFGEPSDGKTYNHLLVLIDEYAAESYEKEEEEGNA